MYYIGIDISKFKHDCAVIDDSERIVTPSWSFTNDAEGFSQLKLLLNSLDTETRIGLESTGHYGMNLKLFLESTTFHSWSSILCLSIVSLNPSPYERLKAILLIA